VLATTLGETGGDAVTMASFTPIRTPRTVAKSPTFLRQDQSGSNGRSAFL